MARGNVHKSLGEYERAAVDWGQAIRIDGTPRAKSWQEYLKGKGYYSGANDGVINSDFQRGLISCARDPDC